ncbi:FRG domain-containing protein [Aeromonas dhakensis]|nr:FRG domain-containing protein [Aeromonas dhakensis]
MSESPDSLPQKVLISWEEFDKFVSQNRYRDWVYRGQSNSEWKIGSSLSRLFDETNLIHKAANGRQRRLPHIDHERLLLEKFQSHAHIYTSHLPPKEKKLEWLSIMQHFGAPTRMIDVTFSPYIALYFALQSGAGDAALYALKPKHYRRIDEKELEIEVNSDRIFDYEKDDTTFFIAYEPEQSNVRLMAQQGLFLVPSKISVPFTDILGDYYHEDSQFIRFLIPASLRVEGLRRLKRMNITASVLFPGMDGFCKSLHSQVIDTTRQLERVN